MNSFSRDRHAHYQVSWSFLYGSGRGAAGGLRSAGARRRPRRCARVAVLARAPRGRL